MQSNPRCYTNMVYVCNEPTAAYKANKTHLKSHRGGMSKELAEGLS